MDNSVRILHLEDDAADAELVQASLESAEMACQISRVQTGGEFRQALAEGPHDVILADYTLPAYDGVSALRLVRGLCPDVPFIFVSGTMGEDAAIEALTGGATDYVLKHKLLRLAPAVKRALREAENWRERRRAEDRLHESETKLRAIFDHTFQFIGLMTPDGVVIEANRGAVELAGVSESDVLGKPFWETPWWKHSVELQEKLRAAVHTAAGGQFVRFEATHPTHDGKLVYVDFSLTPVRDERGHVVLLIPEGRDITERKLAERERLAHLRFFETMDQVNQTIHGTNDLEQMLSDVLGALITIFDCDRAWLVYPCDPETPSWRVPMERTRPEFPGAFALGLDVPMDPDTARVFRTVRSSSGPVQFGPPSEHTLPGEIAKRFNQQSQIAMAIYPKGDRPYVFGLHQCSYPRVWTPEEERLFQEVGRRLTDGLTSLLTYRELRESERKFRTLFEESFDGLFVSSPAGKILDVNRKGVAILGYETKEEVLRLDLASDVYADPVDRKRILAAAEAQGNAEYELVVKKKNGEEIIAYCSLTPVKDDGGATTSYRGIIRDITERKRMEEADRRLALIVESSDDAIIAKTLEGTILTWNAGAERLYGYSAKEAVGKPISILVPPEHSEELPQLLARIRQGEGITHYETTRIRKDGRRIQISLTVSPLRDAHGNTIGASTIARDITEARRAEEALRESERRQAEAEKQAATGRMAARVAHEINNPLAGITNAFRLIKDAVPADHPDRDMVGRIETEIARIARIVRQMYTLYSPRAEKTADVVVADAIRDVLLMLEPMRREHEVRLDESCDPTGLTVRIAEGALHQIVHNLTANAIEASPRGGIVTVAAKLADDHHDDRDLVEITVRDQGVGIPAEIRTRIFEPFFTSKTDDDSRQGLGLGLSVVKSIVESAGGRIEFEDIPGPGTVFRVFLPHSPKTKEH